MKNSVFVEPQHYIDLFEYDAWASGLLLKALSDHAGAVPDKALELMSHLLRSQAIWFGRVEETGDAKVEVWGRDSLEGCVERRMVNTENWLKMLRSSAAGDFGNDITYRNTRGETYTTELRDILTHVINHGTHHRAQISFILRSAGIAPPQTDYIAYARAR